MDCGPACLKMITDHHGRVVSLQKLREKCHISHGQSRSILSAQNGCCSGTSTEYRKECRQDSSTRCRKDRSDRNTPRVGSCAWQVLGVGTESAGFGVGCIDLIGFENL